MAQKKKTSKSLPKSRNTAIKTKSIPKEYQSIPQSIPENTEEYQSIPESIPQNTKEYQSIPESIPENTKVYQSIPESILENTESIPDENDSDKPVSISIKGQKTDKDYIADMADFLKITQGEALSLIIQKAQQEPTIIEKKIEVPVEKIITKEVEKNLLPGQFIIQFNPEVQTISRKCRTFLKRDGILKAENQEEQLQELVNYCLKYFLEKKYDHIINSSAY